MQTLRWKSKKTLMSNVCVLMNCISMPLPANIINGATSFMFPSLPRTSCHF